MEQKCRRQRYKELFPTDDYVQHGSFDVERPRQAKGRRIPQTSHRAHPFSILEQRAQCPPVKCES